MTETFETPVPWAPEAESGVIGGLLLDNGAIDQIPALRPSDFYSARNGEVFSMICALIADGRVADVVTVNEAITAAGREEAIGGLAYLFEIASSAASTANIKHYAQMVIERSRLRGLAAAGAEINELALARDGSTVAEKLDRAQSLVMSIVETSVERRPVHARVLATSVIDRMHAKAEGKEDRRIVKTGIGDLDRRLRGGLDRGRYYVIAGRPGMGKSTLARQITENVGIAGGVSLYCSQEMPGEEVMTSVLSSVGRIDRGKMRDVALSSSDWENLSFALGQVSNSKLFIDEQSSLTFEAVATKARQVQREAGGLDLIAIDYLQLMSGSGENRNMELTKLSQGIKKLAMSLDVPVLVLSQLNRQVESRANKRPMLSDLRESGAIEQDADAVLGIYRDEHYNPDSPDKGIAEVLWLKDRATGNSGTSFFTWRGEFSRFDDYVSSGAFESQPARKRGGLD